MSRRLATTLAAVAAVAALVVAPARAQEADDGPTGRITLAEQVAWVGEDGAFSLRVDVQRVRQPDDLELEVRLHAPVRNRSQFERTIDGALLGQVVLRTTVPLVYDDAGAVPVVLAPPGATGEPAATLPPLRPGVHPVAVVLRERGGGVVDEFTTHLVRLPDDPDLPPLRVSWVQPFGASPALRPDGTTEIDRRTLDDLRTVAESLAAGGAPVTLVPTPETLDGLVALERDDVLDDLRASVAAGSDVVAQPYVDLPVPLLAATSRRGELAVQRARGRAAIEGALDTEPDTRTWTVRGPVDPAALRGVRDAGVGQLVLGEDAVEPLPSRLRTGLTLLRPFLVHDSRGNELRAATADSGLAEHFTDDEDQVLAAHHLLADLAVLFGDEPGRQRGAVVHPPRDWTPTTSFLATVLEGLDSSPALQPVTFSQLLDDVPMLADADGTVVTRELVSHEAPPSAVGNERLPRIRAQLDALSSLTDVDVAEVTILERLLLVAQAAELSRAEREAYLDTVDDRLDHLVGLVRVLERGNYRLTAREGTIPLTVRNDNPYPVRVVLRLASDKLEFAQASPDEPGTLVRPLELEPGNNAVTVDVVARTSGDFPLRIELRSPDGRLDLGRTRVTIRSTVASGVGMALSVGAGLFLLVWWARHWRTSRRDRRLVGAPAPADA